MRTAATAIAALVIAVGAALAAQAQAGDRLRLAYTVYFGPLPALDVTVAIAAEGERYRVEASVAPKSWIAWALPWQARSEASGRQVSSDPAVRPEAYRATATWGTRTRVTALAFAGDGGVRVTLEPAGDTEGREPVPAAAIGDSLDPVSAVFSLLVAIDGGQGCPRAIPVFDGRRRFDIQGEARPSAMIAASRYSAYAGPAVVCRLHFRSLAGGWRDGERGRFWQTETPGGERPPIELSLAWLRDGTLPVPVLVAGPSILGWVTVTLSAYSFDP